MHAHACYYKANHNQENIGVQKEVSLEWIVSRELYEKKSSSESNTSGNKLICTHGMKK